jgi:hypothetical protein
MRRWRWVLAAVLGCWLAGCAPTAVDERLPAPAKDGGGNKAGGPAAGAPEAAQRANEKRRDDRG